MHHEVESCYLTRIIEIEGEPFVLLPDALVDELGWRIGDELEVELTGKKTILLRKVDAAI